MKYHRKCVFRCEFLKLLEGSKNSVRNIWLATTYGRRYILIKKSTPLRFVASTARSSRRSVHASFATMERVRWLRAGGEKGILPNWLVNSEKYRDSYVCGTTRLLLASDPSSDRSPFRARLQR